MGVRTDAALAIVVLVAITVAFVRVDASLSPPWFVLGGLATLAFELAAARDPAAVRRYWERPAVQYGTLLLAVAGVIAGARIAPSRALSSGLGALATYLVFLGAVLTVRSLRSGRGARQ